MSYTVHTTNALVISHTNYGEANRLYTLLTEDLGMISAMAQSVRKQESKNRYSLQTFSLLKISLVQGKEFFRITGADPIRHYGLTLAQSPRMYAVMVRAMKLLQRLVQGTEHSAGLFQELQSAFHFVSTESLDIETGQYFETLLILRILSHLGYWPKMEETPWLVDADLSHEVLAHTALNHKNLVQRINASLRETHL